MNRKQRRFQEAVSLHGKAWLAIDAFCKHVLGEEYLNAHDADFSGRTFYPPVIIAKAKERMGQLFHEAQP